MIRREVEKRKVVVLTGYTDLRRGISGLAAIVKLKYGLNPLEKGTLFLFCGRRRNSLKALIYEGDGFTLAYKRLTNGYFRWPGNTQEARKLTLEEYDRLVSGFDIDSSIREG